MTLKNEVTKRKEQLGIADAFSDFYTEDLGMLEIMHYAKLLAETDCNILITGETGTGKELFAEAIHRMSKRKNSNLVRLNINAIPKNLIESTLFGAKKGAYSGAVSDSLGHFHEANRGTIFLDEIGDLELCCQVKLLRVIEKKEFFPVGSNKVEKSDFRLITATNKDLDQDIQTKKFREDLYFRLSVGHIKLPPLRERANDITVMAQHFLRELCKKNGVKRRFTPDALYQLQAYKFPGNVRELRHLIEFAFYKSAQEDIGNDCLKFIEKTDRCTSINETQLITLEELKMRHIETMVKIHKTRKNAADALGISVRQLYKYLEKYNLSA